MSYFLIVLLCLVIAYFLKNTFSKKEDVVITGYETLDDKFNASKKEKEEELNRLLDKVNKKGLDNLSNKDKRRLEELSK